MFRSSLTRIVFAATLLLTSCATPRPLAIQPTTIDGAKIVGLQSNHIRMWGDEPSNDLMAIIAEMKRERRATTRKGLHLTRKHTADILVISGGGSNGAFGAGLLNGWSQSKKRPEFILVTGVSTGALMAPFAFLGPRYDHILKKFYTNYSTRDLLTPTLLAGILGGGSSVASSAPLAKLIAKYITKSVLKRIAKEHMRGRRLLIGTTNLDAERPVIWNMGKIATVGTDRALILFRKIILASAAIPGIFPPVMINVTVKGKATQEMHVDGGTTNNAILLPIKTNIRAIAKRLNLRRKKRRIFIIANDFLDPKWKSVKPSTVDIAGRSISTLIKQNTIGDIVKIYNFSKRSRLDFNLAAVPLGFSMKSKEPFDKEYMTALYKVGSNLGRMGYIWKKKPPTVH